MRLFVKASGAIALLLFTAVAHPVLAEQGPIIAIFDMEDRGAGLSQQVLDNLTEYLALLLAERGYQIIPREQIRERLVEQKKESFRSCYDQSCQIELGRELAAQKALATRVLKIADTCQVGATLFDLKKAATERAASEETNCNEKSLLEAVKKIAEKLAGQHEKILQEQAMPVSKAEETGSSGVEKTAPAAVQTSTATESASKESPLDDHKFALGIKLGTVLGSKGEDWVVKLSKDSDRSLYGITNLETGFFGELFFDWRFSRGWSLGGALSLFGADTRAVRLEDRDNKIGFLSLLATIKYHWRIHRNMEIRPTANLGLGVVTGGGGFLDNHVVDTDGFAGLSIETEIEYVWYLARKFALIADLGFVASPVTKGKDT